MTTSQSHSPDSGEDGHFVSMTDLMVGLLLVFIIILMFFVLQLDRASEKAEEARSKMSTEESSLNNETERPESDANREEYSPVSEYGKEFQQENLTKIQSAHEVRKSILTELEAILSDRGVPVHIDLEQGVVRLPGSILFKKFDYKLNERGVHTITQLAYAFDRVLPCYSFGVLTESHVCKPRSASIESVYIEGHADCDKINTPTVQVNVPYLFVIRDNMDLSVIRAATTFREVISKSTKIKEKALLLQLVSPQGVPVLNVSGYGAHRPVNSSPDSNCIDAKNRRIDIRILMAIPNEKDTRDIRQEVIFHQSGE